VCSTRTFVSFSTAKRNAAKRHSIMPANEAADAPKHHQRFKPRLASTELTGRFEAQLRQRNS
jgi:hypothetical protein